MGSKVEEWVVPKQVDPRTGEILDLKVTEYVPLDPRNQTGMFPTVAIHHTIRWNKERQQFDPDRLELNGVTYIFKLQQD